MLPRLRFVVAAVVIAMLPMLFLGSAPVSVPALPEGGVRLALAMTDGPDASDIQALGYARRADELGRLRALASEPLETWVTAPAGDEPVAAATAGVTQAAEDAAPASPPEDETATAPAVVSEAPAETAPPMASSDAAPAEAAADQKQISAEPDAAPAPTTEPPVAVASATPPPTAEAPPAKEIKTAVAALPDPPAAAPAALITAKQTVLPVVRVRPKTRHVARHRAAPRKPPPQPQQPTGLFAFFTALFGQQPTQAVAQSSPSAVTR